MPEDLQPSRILGPGGPAAATGGAAGVARHGFADGSMLRRWAPAAIRLTPLSSMDILRAT